VNPEPLPVPTRTHRDLIRRDLCPALALKQRLTHSIDQRIYDDRTQPGDGYSWCLRTCTAVGPDDELAEPATCLPGRACYDGPQS
jgi:hypothetical protein